MARQSWGYQDHNGPEVWHELFPLANGDRQSPIAIKSSEVKYDPFLRPLSFSYDLTSPKVILNCGYAFSIECDDTEDRSDYCNILYLPCSASTMIKQLQTVQNTALRLIYSLRKHDHITAAYLDSHGLPIQARVQFKFCCLLFKTINGDSPAYLNNRLTTSTRHRRPQPPIRGIKRKKLYDGLLATQAAKLDDQFSNLLRTTPDYKSFRKEIKTILFKTSLKTN
uniref:Uncharacterized protein LOC117355606 isoform X3 n=1 Tax=Geotrypetes seraphini TaxID=260995 RepID=A0A6P8QUS3_GEOSA|nr:uncharacterized protein LOC117355606 isoform X3 [Geotrypetes seraphini]